MKTKSGTDIETVRRLNENSGLTYNQAKEILAKRMIKKQNEQN